MSQLSHLIWTLTQRESALFWIDFSWADVKNAEDDNLNFTESEFNTTYIQGVFFFNGPPIKS